MQARIAAVVFFRWGGGGVAETLRMYTCRRRTCAAFYTRRIHIVLGLSWGTTERGPGEFATKNVARIEWGWVVGAVLCGNVLLSVLHEQTALLRNSVK